MELQYYSNTAKKQTLGSIDTMHIYIWIGLWAKAQIVNF